MTYQNRQILLAAEELFVQHATEGRIPISLQEVARKANMTDAELALLYGTESELETDLIDFAVHRWSQLLSAVAGAQRDTLSVFDRHRVYVTTLMTGTEIADASSWLFSSASNNPVFVSAWLQHVDPWCSAHELNPDARSLLSAAKLCAEGAVFGRKAAVLSAANIDSARPWALRLIDDAEAAVSAV